jgi:hypothetical protein
VTYACSLDLSAYQPLVLGDYEIIYYVEIDGIMYTRTLYVFVVERDYKTDAAMMMKLKEDFL